MWKLELHILVRRKPGTKFQIKYLTKNQHEHDLINYSQWAEPNCDKDYLGETGRRIIERAGAKKISNLTYLNMH